MTASILDRYLSWMFPKDVSYEVVFDQASFISQSVNNVLTAAIIGGVLAIIILYIFLRDPRSTVIIAVSIPISIMCRSPIEMSPSVAQ